MIKRSQSKTFYVFFKKNVRISTIITIFVGETLSQKEMNYGFVKMAAAVPEVRVADPKFNVQAIENLVLQAEGRGVEVICFPELSLTGYSCGDLFCQQLLLDEAEMSLIHLMNIRSARTVQRRYLQLRRRAAERQDPGPCA